MERRRFTAEFKREAVNLAGQEGGPDYPVNLTCRRGYRSDFPTWVPSAFLRSLRSLEALDAPDS